MCGLFSVIPAPKAEVEKAAVESESVPRYVELRGQPGLQSKKTWSLTRSCNKELRQAAQTVSTCWPRIRILACPQCPQEKVLLSPCLSSQRGGRKTRNPQGSLTSHAACSVGSRPARDLRMTFTHTTTKAVKNQFSAKLVYLKMVHNVHDVFCSC